MKRAGWVPPITADDLLGCAILVILTSFTWALARIRGARVSWAGRAVSR